MEGEGLKRNVHPAVSLILVIILVSSILGAAPGRAQEDQPQETALLPAICSSTLRIMPLGDSITKGSSGEVPNDQPEKQIAYRKNLWESLKAARYSVDFVGSQTNGQFYSGFDAQHEGYGGVHADFIQYNIYSFLDANPADVILLHIGTNDIGTAPTPGQPLPEIVTEVDQILENIDLYESDHSTHISVILAQIINRIGGSQATKDFNTLLKQMAESRIAAGDDIILVNMETGAEIIYKDYTSGGDMYWNGSNGLHPYHTGYTKMAAVWMQAIESLYEQCNQAPVVKNPGAQSSAEYEPASLKIQASDPDQKDILTFTAENLPVGLSINSSSGLISGQIDRDASQGSPYPVKVIVTDNGNPIRSSQVSFKWTVDPRQLVFLPLALSRKK
jgi:lysophospholipase L1-like esterase